MRRCVMFHLLTGRKPDFNPQVQLLATGAYIRSAPCPGSPAPSAASPAAESPFGFAFLFLVVDREV